MKFSERMKDFIDQGMAASKEFALKAGAKVQDLGERGILMVDIKQLEGRAQKLMTRLGNEAFTAFIERNQDTLEKNAPEVNSVLEELVSIRDAVDQKEAELSSRRGTA